MLSGRRLVAKKEFVRAIALISLLAVSVYLNGISNEFVMDDLNLIKDNLSIRKLSNFLDILTSSYRPLRYISYAVDYHFWGLNSIGYHLTNIILHLFCSLLVYSSIRKLVKKNEVALIAAVLFAVHPIHTDAVTYLAGRRDVLFAFFYLCAFLFFLNYRETGRRKHLYFLFLFFIMSLLSKEMAASLPFLLFGFDYIQRFRTEHRLFHPGYCAELLSHGGRTLKQHLVFYLGLFALVPLATFYYVSLRHASMIVSGGKIEWWGGSVCLNFLNAAYLLIHYIKKLFLPIVLVADNSSFPLIRSIFELRAVAAVAVSALLCFLIIYFLRRNKSYSFALFFFVVSLLPVMHIIPHHEFMAEHYLYLPSFGFCLLLGLLLQRLVIQDKKVFRLVPVFIVLVVLLFSVRTLLRNQDWMNEFTIYHKDLQAYPENRRVHLVLGKAYMDAFDYERAMAEFEHAIQGEEVFKEAYAYRAFILYKRGNIHKAIRQAHRSLEIADWDFPHFNLGKYYQTLGDNENALQHFQKVSSGKYALAARVYTFQIYQKDGKENLADEMAARIIVDSKARLDVVPNDQEALRNLARCYEWTLQFDASEKMYKQLATFAQDLSYSIRQRIEEIESEKQDFLLASERLREDSHDGHGLFLMGKVHYQVGRYASAFEFLSKAIQADPNHAEAYFYLANIYGKKDEIEKGISSLKEAVVLDSERPEFYYLMGRLYAGNLDFERAIDAFARAELLGMKGAAFESEYKKSLLNRKRYQNLSKDRRGRLDLARIYKDYGDYASAAILLEDLEQIAANDAELLHEIGALYATMGYRHVGDAIRIYRSILRFSPDDASAYAQLGYIYWKEVQELPLVIDYFRRSLDIDPNQSTAAEMRNVVEYLRGIYQE